jgi:hypothetical protein
LSRDRDHQTLQEAAQLAIAAERKGTLLESATSRFRANQEKTVAGSRKKVENDRVPRVLKKLGTRARSIGTGQETRNMTKRRDTSHRTQVRKTALALTTVPAPIQVPPVRTENIGEVGEIGRTDTKNGM